MTDEKIKPIRKYKAGTLEVAVWRNEGTSENEEFSFNTFSFNRSFKDKNGEWKTTTILRREDLPKLRILLDEAYKEEVLKSEN
jgi:hypothetical protein